MYRDETKNLMNLPKSIDWSKFNTVAIGISASMADAETCYYRASTIHAVIEQFNLRGTSFIYFLLVGFSNNYQNELGLSNSRTFNISVDNIKNSTNDVTYSAYPIGGVINDADTYDYKIWVETDMIFKQISINSSTSMPPSVLSNLKTWWVLLPNIYDIFD